MAEKEKPKRETLTSLRNKIKRQKEDNSNLIDKITELNNSISYQNKDINSLVATNSKYKEDIKLLIKKNNINVRWRNTLIVLLITIIFIVIYFTYSLYSYKVTIHEYEDSIIQQEQNVADSLDIVKLNEISDYKNTIIRLNHVIEIQDRQIDMLINDRNGKTTISDTVFNQFIAARQDRDGL